jgi:hypothetical protein
MVRRSVRLPTGPLSAGPPLALPSLATSASTYDVPMDNGEAHEGASSTAAAVATPDSITTGSRRTGTSTAATAPNAPTYRARSEPLVPPEASPPPPPPADNGTGIGGGEVYYRNCDQARAAGAAPLYRGEPGYRPALDRDNDGVACE